MIGKSLTYAGVYMGGEDYGVTNARAARMAMADPKLDQQSFGTNNGGISQGAYLKSRSWSDSWVVTGTSRDDLKQKRDNINKLLDPRLGARSLIYDQDINHGDVALDRRHTAVTNGPIFQHQAGLCVTFALNWLNPYGFEYALSATVETPTIAASPQVFNVPVAADEVTEGNNDVSPVIVLENTSGGAVTSITLTNTTRGQTLRWTGVFADTQFMQIDCFRQYISSSATGAFAGEESNRMAGLTAGDPFPLLTAQSRDAWSLTGFSTANATFTFTAEFL